MRLLLHPIFILAAAAYALLRLLQWIRVDVPELVVAYLADLACMPVLLGLTVVALRLLRKDSALRLTPAMILVAWLATSVLFEVVLPQRGSIYTGDVWDVVMYGVGSLLFVVMQQQSTSESLQAPVKRSIFPKQAS